MIDVVSIGVTIDDELFLIYRSIEGVNFPLIILLREYVNERNSFSTMFVSDLMTDQYQTSANIYLISITSS